jgi:tetratricopeptide (TPR) repeat protein
MSLLATVLGKAGEAVASAIGKRIGEAVLKGDAKPADGLPRHLSQFQGREAEVETIREIVGRDGKAHVAICAVQGMGGVGKTCLAEHVSALVRDQFERVLTVNLQGTKQPLSTETAMITVLAQLDPQFKPPEGQALAALYNARLSGRRVLLILDNARDTAQVEPLLPPEPGACIITSRQRIALPDVHCIDVDEIDPEGARAILRGYVGEDRADDALLDDLACSCYRVPLALDTVGRYLRHKATYRVADYAAKLKADRKGKLAMVMDRLGESYDQLNADSPDMAAHWTLLVAFPASFAAKAVEAVCGVADGQDFLCELEARGLIREAMEEERGDTFYRLHDFMRDLAEIKAEAEALYAARRRHAEFFHRALGAADELYQAGKPQEGLASFDTCRADVDAALAWAQTYWRDDDDAARACIQLYNAGVFVLGLRLSAGERLGWLEPALEAARKLGPREAEGRALGNLGCAYDELGKTDRAIDFHQQSRAIFRETGDRQGEANALFNLGVSHQDLGQSEAAIAFMEQALALYDALKMPDAANARRVLAFLRGEA